MLGFLLFCGRIGVCHLGSKSLILSFSLVFLAYMIIVFLLQWSYIDMVANSRGQCLTLVISNYLTEDVHYFLYDQLPHTVKTFWRVTVLCIASIVCVHSCDYNVLISLETLLDELVLNRSLLYGKPMHLFWNRIKYSENLFSQLPMSCTSTKQRSRSCQSSQNGKFLK